MSLPTYFLLLLSFQQAPVDPLEASVKSYFDALGQRDKVAASSYVHPADLNNFYNRNDAAFSGWAIQNIEPHGAEGAEVVVRIQQVFFGRVSRPVSVHTKWVEVEGRWMVRVPSAEDLQKSRFQPYQSAPKMPHRLDVVTDVLKLYGITTTQSAALVIRNGLDEPVEVVSVEVDPRRFLLKQVPESIAARTTGKVWVVYVGKEEGENLSSRLRLVLSVSGQEREYEIPILYNYWDEQSRWMNKMRGKNAAPPPPADPPSRVKPPRA